MAKWSVALFGHQKFIPNEVDSPVEYAAAIKRTEPGDIVAYKPYNGETQWTDLERRRFLIVTIDGPTEGQILALVEKNFDLTSYRIYDPLDNGSWRSQLIAQWNTLTQTQKDQMLAWWNSLSTAEQDSLYDEYIVNKKNECRYPTKYIKKRRFTITQTTLSNAGVNLTRMFDTSDLYDPYPDFIITDPFDRINDRNILITDGLNVIQPLADNELITP